MIRVACVLAIFLPACGPEYEVVLVLPDAEARAAAVRAEIAVLMGACPSPVSGEDPSPTIVVKAVTWSIGREAPDIGELDSGSYGLYGRVRDVTCAVRWAGCTEELLREDGDSRIEIELERVAGPGCLPWETCDETGRCACGEAGDSCDGTVGDACCPTGCADLTEDPLNCGRCGQTCPGMECAVAACEEGQCGIDPVPLEDGTPCSDGGVCEDGRCTVSCTPGETEDRSCGSCGTQYRQCGEEGQWGVWGDCDERGDCELGGFESVECGNCGTQSRTCGATCWWSDWSSCTGEGECNPGDVDQIPCGECGTQAALCNQQCEWSEMTECGPDRETGDETCEDGNLCTDDWCDEDGTCDGEDECPEAAPVCCGSSIGCGECCGDDPSTCEGPIDPCMQWMCRDTRECYAVQAENGTDPRNACGNAICCDGTCVACCGSDVSTCGAEPRCADWACQSGSCIPAYESNWTDPENECTDPQCCDGSGNCADSCG
ncbi:MAG: hypothetical protein HYY06_22285 [Deltaproteobacteria bacterium]|nr:hypothetical protein [Deltaproteobacteria bacterium]